jgi:hypothetical protein
VPKQRWGHGEKFKGSKRFEFLKITDTMILNQVKNEENKEKEPKTNIEGHNRPFWKDIPKIKGHQISTSDPHS